MVKRPRKPELYLLGDPMDIDEIPAHAGSGSVQDADATHINASERRKRLDWFGGQDAETRLRDGWPEGYQRAQEALRAVEVPIDVFAGLRKRRKRRRGPDGDDLELDVLTGAVDLDRAWIACHREQSAGRHVTISVAGTVSCGVRAEEYFFRGACAIVATEMLRAAGFHVTLLGDFTNGGARGEQRARAPRIVVLSALSRSDRPVDPEQIAGLLCQPYYFRWHVLRMVERRWGKHTPGGHGSVDHANDGELAGLGIDPAAVYRMDSNDCLGAGTAEKWLRGLAAFVRTVGEREAFV